MGHQIISQFNYFQVLPSLNKVFITGIIIIIIIIMVFIILKEVPLRKVT